MKGCIDAPVTLGMWPRNSIAAVKSILSFMLPLTNKIFEVTRINRGQKIPLNKGSSELFFIFVIY
ncbi:hypothetical protein A8L45_02920 [Veronia pacifica]|uniref:Uncharacterized protein n=1 Tax=Veronia pacifica TaxID=1080227 RepID=A0A1C3EQS3_9GAMM|nr:hypothetical protein A8L45_02920 [Veronia pacifica]